MTLIVIPARWGSRRLPGKPLRLIAGHTLLSRTIDLAIRARSGDPSSIMVATDDDRIAAHARACGVSAMITDAGLSSGTARSMAVVEALDTPVDHIVNLQCDAPFIPADAVGAVIAALSAGADVATPVVPLDWAALDALRLHKRTAPFSGTTCVVDERGRAIWFSKQIIPALRDEEDLRRQSDRAPVLRHIGLYGYTIDALKRFCAAPSARYERLEGLEQLRLLSIGIPIQTVAVTSPPVPMNGIDTQEDIDLAERLIARLGDPFGT